MVTLLIRIEGWWSAVLVVAFLWALVIFSYKYGSAGGAAKALPSEIVRISADRPDVDKWVREKLQQASTPIQIDGLGVKLDSLYRVVRGTGPGSCLPEGKQCNVRVLVLARGSFGAHMRTTIEQHEKVMRDVELYNQAWADLARKYSSQAVRVVQAKAFEFTPAFYLVRINNWMIVGTYLAETGYDNVTLELTRQDGSVYDQFQRYFDAVWHRASSNLE